MKTFMVAVTILFAGCVQQGGGAGESERQAGALEGEPLGEARLAPKAPLAEPTPQLAGDPRLTATAGPLAIPPPLSATSMATVSPTQASAISKVREVTVAFEVVGVSAPSVAAVEFVGPSGAPYERREVPVHGSAFEPLHLEVTLPVAGTVVDTTRMSGVWLARLSIDGQVVRTQRFELTP